MTMQRFMVDIEALGTEPDSIILSIGCVAFNLNRIGASSLFYTRVKVESCEAIGLKMYWDTVKWWLDQGDIARREVTCSDGAATIYNALIWLSDFIKSEAGGRDIRIYAKDPDFDCVILREAYKRTHIDLPWLYTQTRSVRTTLEDAGMQTKLRVQHHALNDAVVQAQAVQKALNPDLFIKEVAV